MGSRPVDCEYDDRLMVVVPPTGRGSLISFIFTSLSAIRRPKRFCMRRARASTSDTPIMDMIWSMLIGPSVGSVVVFTGVVLVVLDVTLVWVVALSCGYIPVVGVLYAPVRAYMVHIQIDTMRE